MDTLADVVANLITNVPDLTALERALMIPVNRRKAEMGITGFTAHTLFRMDGFERMASLQGLTLEQAHFLTQSRQTGESYRVAVLYAAPHLDCVIAAVQVGHDKFTPEHDWYKVLLRPTTVDGGLTLIAVCPGWPL